MWYVIEADPGSTLIAGFNKELTQEEYLERFNSGHLTDVLNKEDVKAGDVFFLPAGRVHTIGKGLLIAEIQQTSDITYRIYDFDRVMIKAINANCIPKKPLQPLITNITLNIKPVHTSQR